MEMSGGAVREMMGNKGRASEEKLFTNEGGLVG